VLKTKVTYAVLHNPVFVKDVGQLKATLDRSEFSQDRKFDMALLSSPETGSFLLLSLTAKVSKKPVEIVIPMTNVSHFILAEPV